MPHKYVLDKDMTLYHITNSDDSFEIIDLMKPSGRLVPESFSLTRNENDPWPSTEKFERVLVFQLKAGATVIRYTGAEIMEKGHLIWAEEIRKGNDDVVEVTRRSNFPDEFAVRNTKVITKIDDYKRKF